MSFNFACGTISSGTSAADVNIPVGFSDVKVILLWATRPGASSGAQHAVMGFGWGVNGDGDGSRPGFSTSAEDNLSTTDTRRTHSPSRPLYLLNGTTATHHLIAYVSAFGSTSTLTIGTAPATSIDIHWAAFCGGSVSAASTLLDWPASTGTSPSITGLSFQPNILIGASIQLSGLGGNTIMALDYCVAVNTPASEIKQAVFEIISDNAAGAANARRYAQDGEILASTPGFGCVAAVTSFNSDGVTINWNPVAGAGNDLWTLAIKVPYADLVLDTITTSGASQSFGSTSFTPNGCIVATHGTSKSTLHTLQDTNSELAFGATDGTNQWSVWCEDDDGADPTDSNSYDSSSLTLDLRNTGAYTAHGSLDFSAFTATGITFDKPTAFNEAAFAAFLLVGDVAPAPPLDDIYTRDVLETAGPVPGLAFVLEIEGYPTLLTSWSDTAAVLTAYAATEWAAAVCCLYAPGTYRQGMKPWQPELKGGTCTFTIYPREDTDQFGVDLWSSVRGTGHEGYLQADIDSDALALTLDDADEFAASGALHAGVERLEYTSRDTGTEVVTISKRGTYAPWKANTETLPRFGRTHRLGTVQTARLKPRITDYPRTWLGKWVRLNVHVVRGGVMNLRSYALKWFAGRIADVQEEPDGRIVLTCTDAVEAVGSAIIFREQWRATVPEGLYVTTWMTGLVSATESWVVATAGTPTGSGGGTTTALVVKTSGATPPGEINKGYYTIDELCGALNAWLAGDGNITQSWHFGIAWDEHLGGWRTEIEVAFETALGGTGSLASAEISLPRDMAVFLGFADVGPGDGVIPVSAMRRDGNTSVTLTMRSRNAPMRVRAFQSGQVPGASLVQLDAEGATGVWFDQTAYLPTALGELAASGSNWGIVRVGGTSVALAQYTSDTSIGLVWTEPLRRMFGEANATAIGGYEAPTIYYGEAGDIEVVQILALQGEVKTLIMKLVCSTGTTGYNHATYDALPYGMGAEVPYELLGDGFEASVAHLSAMTGDESVTMLITSRMYLAGLLLPEMTLRNAHLVWTTDGLRFITPQSPDASTAPFALTEMNKVDRPGRSLARWTRDHLLNVVEVKYGYRLDDGYSFGFPIANVASITDHGVTSPVTLYGRNTFGASSQLGDALRGLIAEVAGYVLTTFADPIVVVERGFNSDLVCMYPGAALSYTDSHTRSASGGTRGVQKLPAWALTTTWDWGSAPPRGTVEMAIVSHQDPNRRTQYSPCVRIDETATNGGYDSGTSTLTCVQHEHSWSSEAADLSHLSDDDEVTIISYGEYGGAVESWDRTISGTPTATTVVFTGGVLTGWTATKKHRIVSRTYASATAAQQTKAYLGDSADGKIDGSVLARRWSAYSLDFDGEQVPVVPSPAVRPEPIWASGVDLVSEGMPVNPGVHAAFMQTIDNQISYKSAPGGPMLAGDSDCLYTRTLTLGDSWYGMLLFPFAVGKGDFPSRWRRRLRVAPQFYRQSGTGTLTCRVSSMKVPPSGGQWIDAVLSTPVKSVLFTTTSATIQISARQALELVVDQDRGVTLIYVEVKSDVAGDVVAMTGLAELWLGPLE